MSKWITPGSMLKITKNVHCLLSDQTILYDDISSYFIFKPWVITMPMLPKSTMIDQDGRGTALWDIEELHNRKRRELSDRRDLGGGKTWTRSSKNRHSKRRWVVYMTYTLNLLKFFHIYITLSLQLRPRELCHMDKGLTPRG